MAEWVVLELSSKADGEDPDLIRLSIRHQIKDAEVYLPVSVTKVGGDKVINYLVEGYAFIKRMHDDARYFRLEGSRYVQAVISHVGRGSNGRPVRQIACAKDSDIDRFRNQIHVEENQGIGVGDLIIVTSGPYRHIQATVIEDIPEREEVTVHIKLRSKEDLVTLPRSFLRLLQRASRSPYLDRVEGLRAWVTSVKPFLLSDDRRFIKIVSLATKFQQLDVFSSLRKPYLGFFDVLRSQHNFAGLVEKLKSFQLYDTFSRARIVFAPPQDPKPLRERGAALVRLAGWETRWNSTLLRAQSLRDLEQRVYSPLPLSSIQEKYQTLEYIDEVFERLGVMKEQLDAIEHSMNQTSLYAEEKGEGIGMVLVDGHNLAIRCATVPGLSDLKDKQGRPTGAILGVLRSLAGFSKRFSGAKITVVWDGSSQRRKGIFADYKGNRPSHGVLPAEDPAFDPVRWLKDTLPLLGIEQAWNPKEEADDIIATLVRQAAGTRCVIITTDRDMLQLVSDTVQVYIPGKDKLFDRAMVEAEYGVQPERMVDLRSFDGDSSDNIPGVPGFGLKTAAKLLRLYGSVEGVYSSTFAGVSPDKYKKLRAAEKQVRLNVRLMSLHTDLHVEVVCPNPDQSVAKERLQDVDVQAAPVLSALFAGG
jgi:5'-3' exonuclease/transcription antitermination factor NusG